jgi:hypothetical protein
LPAKLMAAFARLGENPPPAEELPNWPRAVRIAIDYAMCVAIADVADMKNDQADAFARTCTTLGALQAKDPPGDPPASCAARDAAESAGSDYARAFDLLGQIRDSSAQLLQRGNAVPALPAATMQLLQQAARGEPVPDSELNGVLEAAQHLQDRLGFSVLT